MALILLPITLTWVAFVVSAVFRVPIALTNGGVALWLWHAINARQSSPASRPSVGGSESAGRSSSPGLSR
jgi:hypothetical protein